MYNIVSIGSQRFTKFYYTHYSPADNPAYDNRVKDSGHRFKGSDIHRDLIESRICFCVDLRFRYVSLSER